MSQLVPYLPILSLVAAGFIALPRAWALRRRGVTVVAVDRQRTALEMGTDSLLVAALLFWLYLVVGVTGWLPIGFLPAWLAERWVDGAVPRALGSALLVGWVVVYGLGVRTMGDSWRLGIDRQRSGPLVTGGVFRWSRNPIYLAFNMLFWGTALVDGRVVLALLAAVLASLLHGEILREERFLASQFGQAYTSYRGRVGRYVTWPHRPPGLKRS